MHQQSALACCAGAQWDYWDSYYSNLGILKNWHNFFCFILWCQWLSHIYCPAVGNTHYSTKYVLIHCWKKSPTNALYSIYSSLLKSTVATV